MSKRDHHDLARRLLRKARGDEASLERLLGDPDIPDEAVGLHAQQAVEKLLKTVLAQHEVDYPRIHDVEYLLDLLADNGIAEPPERDKLSALTPWAAALRYEDEFDQALDRQATLALVKSVRSWADKLMLPEASGEQPEEPSA